MNYRNTARTQCNSAKALVATKVADNLLFAALKLRMALECLTYDRSKGYVDDLGPEVMKTWQPKKLMERMLEVDPSADADATLSFGEEPSPGETPEQMQLLGTDRVLNLRTLKKHYDALGSYLHTPTLAQIEQGKTHDFDKLRRRCEQIIDAVETALASKVWNSTFTVSGEIDCLECGTSIKRRLLQGPSQRAVQCWNCSASYNMSDIGEGKIHFEPRQTSVPCPSKDCDETSYIWERDLKQGQNWTCQGCGTRMTLALGLTVARDNES